MNTARPIAELIAHEQLRRRRVQWRMGRASAAPGVRRFGCRPPSTTVTHASPPEIRLLADRDVGAGAETRFFYVNLPATASLTRLVRFGHQRWPIEQQYQERAAELGPDRPFNARQKYWVQTIYFS